ncbi:MAG: polysaccharide biosynthesis tyrosine autokinase [Verrucomicrobiia bacterium]
MSDLVPVKQVPTPAPAPAADPGYPGYSADDGGYAPARSSTRLIRMLAFLRRFWWVPVLTTLLGTAAGIAYLFRLPPTYVSVGQMWETEKLRLSEAAAFTEDAQTYYGTQMQLVQSPRMSRLALESLLAAGTNNVPRDKDGLPLKVSVSVKQQPKSAVFYLEASSANPVYARAYLNSLMAAFQTYRRSIRESQAGTTWSSISDQVKRLEGDLKGDQAALADFQKTNNLAILQEEGTISGGYLARKKTELSELQLEAKLLEIAAAEREWAGATNANSLPVDQLQSASLRMSGTVAAEWMAAFKEVELLKAHRDKLGKVYKPKHPKIAKLTAEIERAQHLIDLHRNQSQEQLANARRSVQMRIESVQTSIQEWEQKVVDSKARIAEAERLTANVTRSQSLYDRLMMLLENVDITRNINQETLTVLEEASPAQRSFRREIAVVGMGAFLGLAAGLGLILLIEIRDDRFISVTEVTDKFGDSIVGQVPDVRALGVQTGPLLDNGEVPHTLAESYRSLRSALFFLPTDAQSPRVILVTSALPDEGKSTVAANLAKTIAMGGARVLLVDADLRRGKLHEMLGLKAEPGLSQLLTGSGQSMDAVQSNCLPNLSFIARGATPKRSGDLFVGAAFAQLLARWRAEFDYVVIDSCPVFAADDATTLAPKVDGTLFVVRRGYSGAKVVHEALRMLLQRQAKVLGLVFNRADPFSRSYYYYKHAEYYEGAGQSAKG